MKANDQTPSKAERAKHESRYLRGTIDASLGETDSARFGEGDVLALKFHGIYQQDDRDERRVRQRAGLDKLYSFMIRVRLPAGRATAAQYSVIDDLASRYGGGSVRITTRQALQLHGVLKDDLRPTLRSIDRMLLTTFAACGDVARNVMAPPVPYAGGAYGSLRDLADALAAALLPRTRAYHEVWLEGERVADGVAGGGARPNGSSTNGVSLNGASVNGASPNGATANVARSNGASATGGVGVEEEPLYGRTYLPRKFKLAVTLDGDNSIDAWTQDLALIGHAAGPEAPIDAITLLVGGGLGITHNKAQTFARLGTPLATIGPGDAIDVVRTIVRIFRDGGDRADRRHARLKYMVEEWGVERFRAEVERRLGRPLAPPRDLSTPCQHDGLGWIEQGDGRVSYGMHVPSGRIADVPDGPRYRSAVRAIIHELEPSVVLTPMQSILFTDLEPGGATRVLAILSAHGVPTVERLSPVRRHALACPALPTCGLALADAERALPEVIDELESACSAHGIDDAPLVVRMTGCPNGCARPYNADIGLVGRRPGVYHVFVGGGIAGDRLADLFAADVPLEELVETLAPLFARFRHDRRAGERLGDFYQRILGDRPPRTVLTGDEQPTRALVEVTVSRGT